jgi:hypothetical protein
MIQPQANKGFTYGSGLISPDTAKFIVNIPKNASSYLLNWSNQNGWFADPAIDFAHTIKEIIIVLRDPEERWVSGFAQYVSGNILHAIRFYNTDTGPGKDFQYMSAQEFIANYNPLVERLIFDNLESFDDHVWPQTLFFKDLLPSVPRRYFYINNDFDQNLQNYLNWAAPGSDLDRNDSNNDLDKKLIKQFINDRLNQVTELRTIITKAYAEDYQLIKQIKQCAKTI